MLLNIRAKEQSQGCCGNLSSDLPGLGEILGDVKFQFSLNKEGFKLLLLICIVSLCILKAGLNSKGKMDPGGVTFPRLSSSPSRSGKSDKEAFKICVRHC